MKKIEFECLIKILRMSADKFSNHSCNDFVIENTPENLEFASQIIDGGEPFIDEDGIYVLDYVLMRYLADMLEEKLITNSKENEKYLRKI